MQAIHILPFWSSEGDGHGKLAWNTKVKFRKGALAKYDRQIGRTPYMGNNFPFIP